MTDAITAAILANLEEAPKDTWPLAEARSVPVKVANFKGEVTGGYTTAQMNSLRPRIFDRRNGKVYANDHVSTPANLNNTTARPVAILFTEEKDGSTTVLFQGDSRSEGQLDFFLPLATSPSDPSPDPTLISVTTPQFSSARLNYHGGLSLRRASTPTVKSSVIGSSERYTSMPFMAYDRLTKTVVYLGGVSQSGVNAEPSPNNLVYRLYANGVAETVPDVKGWKGFLAYVADTTRYERLNYKPDLDPAGTWAAAHRTMGNSRAVTVTTAAGLVNPSVFREYRESEYLYTPNSSGNSSIHFDGSTSWGSDAANLRSETGIRRDVNSYALPNAYVEVPMWVIEEDGSVNLYKVKYTPKTHNHIYKHDNKAAACVARASAGFKYWLENDSGEIIQQGNVEPPSQLKEWCAGLVTAAGGHVGNMIPLYVNPDSKTVGSVVFMQTVFTTGQMGDSGDPYYNLASDNRYTSPMNATDTYFTYNKQ